MNSPKILSCNPIGFAHTPYDESFAPSQPLEKEAAPDAFFIELLPEFTEGLCDVETFSHIYVLGWFDRPKKEVSMKVHPPWAKGLEVGLFAGRSPVRPNPIGLSIVKVLKVEKNRIYISPIDFFDNTPILDIKPYMRGIDSRDEANDGWVDKFEDKDHMFAHLRGKPHDHDHEHTSHHHHDDHEHGHHEHDDDHDHEHSHHEHDHHDHTDHDHDHEHSHRHRHGDIEHEHRHHHADHDHEREHSHHHHHGELHHEHLHSHKHGHDHNHDHEKK